MERQTIQNQKILSYVASVTSHPTAEEVFLAVVKEVPTITRATVYRNLHKLVAQGELSQFSLHDQLHFDAIVEPHIHIIDEQGVIVDELDSALMRTLFDSLKQKGIEPTHVDIICRVGAKGGMKK
ncbi:MAG: transcriptional repressor [Candidatus Woesearchaeota archaeon]|nr:MAG: transcriptional repressor [Candidatus Woesearchaeota archaeon]